MRKVIQISTTSPAFGRDEAHDPHLYALCDDGSLWQRNDYATPPDWERIAGPPEEDKPLVTVRDANTGEPVFYVDPNEPLPGAKLRAKRTPAERPEESE